MILLQVYVPKIVPYFTVLDINEDNICKHVFVYSSSSSQEITCFTSGGGKFNLFYAKFVH